MEGPRRPKAGVNEGGLEPWTRRRNLMPPVQVPPLSFFRAKWCGCFRNKCHCSRRLNTVGCGGLACLYPQERQRLAESGGRFVEVDGVCVCA